MLEWQTREPAPPLGSLPTRRGSGALDGQGDAPAEERSRRFPVPAWPVIGREPELARIADARAAGSRAFVLQGDAGVGKSRLAREALERADRDGAHAAWAQATRSAASVPLGAFAAVIPVEVRSEDRFELLRRSTQALRESAGAGQMVIGVDDGQLLDPTSAALVLHLATSSAAFVVATVRSDEPCPDAIVSLWKDLESPRLELGYLGQADTERLLEAMLGGPVEQRVRSWICETSGGNPLYVRELVLGALASDALERRDGLWRQRAPLPITSSLSEIVDERLAGVSDGERETLELLALGEPLQIAELAEMVGQGRLTALEERGLIAIEGSGRHAEIRLAHPLYAETVRASLGSLRGNRARLRLAETVQSQDQLSPDRALRVARWLTDAGERVPKATLLDAARAANLSGDPELAGQLAEQAVEAGAGVEAALVLARSHSIRNQPERAKEVLTAAESSIKTQEAAVAYLVQQTSVLHAGLMRTDELSDLLRRWQRSWPDDERWRARLARWRLWGTVWGSVEDRNDILSQISVLIDDRKLDPDSRRRLEAVKLAMLYYNGRGREADALARRLRHRPPLRDETDEVVLSAYVAATADTGEGLDELERWANVTMKKASALGDHGAAGLASLALAHRRLIEGRFVDAGRWLAEAQLHQEQHDPIGLLAITFDSQAWRAACTRDEAAADAAFARCRALALGSDPHGIQSRALRAATAWVAIAHGVTTRGRGILIDVATEHRQLPLYAGRLLYEAMRAGEPADHIAAQLTELSDGCQARMLAAKASHATHLAAHHAPGLLKTSAHFQEIGALLYASEAAADAAEVFVEAGRSDSARRAATRSRELHIAGQARPRPVIRGLDADAIELTPREAEVVELARTGLSNGEIAERLVLSKRTIESHMHQAMQKLGIGNRGDL
ncbi:MAG TPA: LuxR C-terminal-related transcriptional regulator [Solirubrobacteraceae bacterium]|nr:LuxR C-terminal-related transcriptional regulator [Solirubrobacteraceae bacterium]HTX12430.1 LuxR C-terminal-related transcriptional regulator [Solirubrobacteraceae bacterium]